MPGLTGLQWLAGWACYILDYYPLLLVAVGLYARRRPAPAGQLLHGLNLLTAAAGLLNLWVWGYELFVGWFSQVEFEQYTFINRVAGPYWWAYWGMLLPRIGSQLFWWPRLRRSWRWSVGYALVWLLLPVLERAVVILTSLHRDYLPSSWGMFAPAALLRWPLSVLALALLLWWRPWQRGGDEQ